MLIVVQLFQEFFMLILREIMDPMYGMFQYFPDSRLMWFSEEVGSFVIVFSFASIQSFL